MRYIKKFIPTRALAILQVLRCKIYRQADKYKPYLNKYKYCGFDLFYTRGEGLVDRIRFGNPDRIYERQLSEKLVVELSKYQKPVFMDIGANIGLISLYVSAKLREVRIFSFEPGSRQSTLFGITLFANQLNDRVSLCTDAVGSELGRASFYEHENESESSGDGFIYTQRGGTGRQVEKKVITLDTWWMSEGCPNINVIKIDIEGAELLALKGGREMLDKCKPIIYLEVSLLNLRVYPHTHRDVFAFLISMNYEILTINETAVTIENMDELVELEDTYIARPKIN